MYHSERYQADNNVGADQTDESDNNVARTYKHQANTNVAVDQTDVCMSTKPTKMLLWHEKTERCMTEQQADKYLYKC